MTTIHSAFAWDQACRAQLKRDAAAKAGRVEVAVEKKRRERKKFATPPSTLFHEAPEFWDRIYKALIQMRHGA